MPSFLSGLAPLQRALVAALKVHLARERQVPMETGEKALRNELVYEPWRHLCTPPSCLRTVGLRPDTLFAERKVLSNLLCMLKCVPKSPKVSAFILSVFLKLLHLMPPDIWPFPPETFMNQCCSEFLRKSGWQMWRGVAQSPALSHQFAAL